MSYSVHLRIVGCEEIVSLIFLHIINATKFVLFQYVEYRSLTAWLFAALAESSYLQAMNTAGICLEFIGQANPSRPAGEGAAPIPLPGGSRFPITRRRFSWYTAGSAQPLGAQLSCHLLLRAHGESMINVGNHTVTNTAVVAKPCTKKGRPMPKLALYDLHRE